MICVWAFIWNFKQYYKPERKKKEKITIAFARLYNTQMHIMLGSQTHRGKTAIRKKKNQSLNQSQGKI